MGDPRRCRKPFGVSLSIKAKVAKKKKAEKKKRREKSKNQGVK